MTTLERLENMERRFNRAGKPFHFTSISASQSEIQKMLCEGTCRHTGWTMRGEPAYMLTGKSLSDFLAAPTPNREE